MKRIHRLAVAAIVAGVGTGATVHAHHEAIFGPHSSLMLSAENFVSVQLFSRGIGADRTTTRETTSVVSAGVRISRARPLMFTATLPYSWISSPPGARASGAEDALIGLRYRHDLKGLQEKWDREGNFVMGVGALELNNGSIDHPSWTGPADAMAALLASVERGRWSGIGYTVTRLNLADASGVKDGNTLFVGGGLAFTPNEDLRTGRLVSVQAGWSFEHYARDRIDGLPVTESGGRELLIHPTVAYSPGHGVLVFGVASVPVWRAFADRASQDRYRLGTGVLYSW